MRIIRSSDLPAVVLVKRRGVRALAIPESLPTSEVLELASLVLSTSEYEELRHAVQPSASGTGRFRRRRYPPHVQLPAGVTRCP